jgi:DNA polymerase-2
MAKIRGFIVDSDYTNIDGKTFVQLFGRLENGQSFVVLNEFSPYFFVKEADRNAVKKLLRAFKVEETSFKNIAGEPVFKISHTCQEDLNKLLKEIHVEKVATYESDLRPHNRFMIDNNLKAGIEIDGDYETSDRVDRVYRNVSLSHVIFTPKLKVLSIDIETSGDKKELFCIGMYSENYKKSFLVSKKQIEGVISCKDEEECLTKFKEELKKFDPDIITGWNVIDFDLEFLQSRFKKRKIPFDISRTNDNLRLKIESNFMKSSSATVVGRQVLDGLDFIQDPFIQEAPSIKSAKFESYTLENVSQQLLGKGKTIKGNNRHIEIESWFHSDNLANLKKLTEYNLIDCELVYEILEKTKMIELSIERSQLTGMTIDRLTASIAAFDSVYIRELRKKGIVSPSVQFGQKEEKLKGGYVASTASGIFHNVLILDFKSLYPSIIKTFNVDPASYLGHNLDNEKNVVEAPNKVYFRNSEGILPQVITELHAAREKAKKEKRELSSYAIKIIMNSFWGVLASPNCRYFDFNMASAITAFARQIIQLTAKKIEEKGYKVIYSDTDSVFVESGVSDYEKADKLALVLQKYINDFYKDYVTENYGRDSYLELEFKKQYISMMFPALRKEGDEDGKKAAKKRYAGLVLDNGKEILEITGLEAIRGDWTEAAQEFQKELLTKVFKKKEIDGFIREYVRDILAGKMDKKLVYRKSIRKNLEEYTKTTPPHVKAARKLDFVESNIIEYFITVDGPEPIQKLKHKLDYEHYIDKQIKPIANQILGLFKKDFDDVLKGTKQKTLF